MQRKGGEFLSPILLLDLAQANLQNNNCGEAFVNVNAGINMVNRNGVFHLKFLEIRAACEKQLKQPANNVAGHQTSSAEKDKPRA